MAKSGIPAGLTSVRVLSISFLSDSRKLFAVNENKEWIEELRTMRSFILAESGAKRDALLPLRMGQKAFLLVLVTAFVSGGLLRTGQAQGLGAYIETYTARLSERDHYNSNGERLRSAAAIIRQDRANYYVYGFRDGEDEPDPYFSSKRNRARLEELLENGRATPDAVDRIVNGTPLIRVDIYATGINVTIISD
jgi:hypothetical protein